MADQSGRWLVWRNVIANYAYVGLMALVTLFLTPIYVRTLGPTEWGAVALCITVQGVLFLLDAGLGQVAPREFASVQGDRPHQLALYQRFERIYVIGAVGAWVVGQLVVGWVVPRVSPDVQEGGMWAVRLILTQFALTFANSAPLGLWNGLQQQQRVNVRQAGFMALKHLGALLSVHFLAQAAWAYVLPFVLVGTVETLLNLWTVRSEYAHERASQQAVDAPSARQLMSHVGGFGVAVLVGMLTSQIDRMMLAPRLSLQEFGAYALVVTLGMAFMNLQQPLQRAFLPKVVASQADARTLFVAVMLVCALPCLVVAWWSADVLKLWVGSRAMAPDSAAVLSLVLIGIAFNGLYAADYTRLVARRAWRPVLGINAAILVAQLAVLHWGGARWGMLAGGWSWMMLGIMQFSLGRLWWWRFGVGRD